MPDDEIPEIDKKVKEELDGIAATLSSYLGEIAGEDYGFVLLTFPIGRIGWHGVVSNCGELNVVSDFMHKAAEQMKSADLFTVRNGRVDS